MISYTHLHPNSHTDLTDYFSLETPDNLALVIAYLIKNSQAVKKGAAPHKGHDEKRCEIQGGGQEMAVMVG